MNRILYAADCLDVLKGEEELPSESIDLIYLDPPFNSNSNYNLPFKGRDKSLKPVEAFKDTWEWTADDNGRLAKMEADPRTRSLAAIVKFAQEVEGARSGRRGKKPSLAAYLINMSLRLLAMRRLLKKTGSIYLHCDPTAGHYLKLLMDSVFGKKNFRNEIVWQRRQDTHNLATKHMGRIHDVILWYGVSPKSRYRIQYLPYDEEYLRKLYNKRDERGRYRLLPCTNEAGETSPMSLRALCELGGLSLNVWKACMSKVCFIRQRKEVHSNTKNIWMMLKACQFKMFGLIYQALEAKNVSAIRRKSHSPS